MFHLVKSYGTEWNVKMIMDDEWNMQEPSYGILDELSWQWPWRSEKHSEQTGQDTSKSGWDLKQTPCKCKARIHTATANSSVISYQLSLFTWGFVQYF